MERSDKISAHLRIEENILSEVVRWIQVPHSQTNRLTGLFFDLPMLHSLSHFRYCHTYMSMSRIHNTFAQGRALLGAIVSVSTKLYASSPRLACCPRPYPHGLKKLGETSLDTKTCAVV